MTAGGPCFKGPNFSDGHSIQLPCGRCIGCRLERSRQWAVRLMHELRDHEQSSFITLTYDDENLPQPYKTEVLNQKTQCKEILTSGNLRKKDFQNFIKELRRQLPGKKYRYFHCGEYGDKKRRPHYHAIMFGIDFAAIGDAYGHHQTPEGHTVWQSQLLDRLWHRGRCEVGSVTFESCAYVARYITKKITGGPAKEHYKATCLETGKTYDREPEYATMSRNPGIGANHAKKYLREIYPSDEVITRGQSCRPPKFYDRILEKESEEDYILVKEARETALELSDLGERSPKRLKTREKVKKAAINHLSRRLDNEN